MGEIEKEKDMVKVLVCVATVIVLILVAIFMLGVYATYSVAKYMNDSGIDVRRNLNDK